MGLVKSSWRKQSHIPPILFLLAGILIGRNGWSFSIYNWCETNADNLILPFYVLLASLYLVHSVLRPHLDQIAASIKSLFQQKVVEDKKLLAPPVELPAGITEEPQPIDLSGAYKLISNHNFEEFLAVQGVPWALRRAANQARPVHRIIHRGRQLTIKIEGIIESQTTYVINGPPVETDVRGRIFEDTVSYAENESGETIGIIVRKKAITEDYDVTVQRVLEDGGQQITLTSTAYFRDDRDDIACKQVFKRIE